MSPSGKSAQSESSTEQQHRPKRIRRLFRMLLILLMVFALLASAALLYFTATTSGLRQLIAISQQWLPGKLEVQQIEGSILSQPDLRGIAYRQPDTELRFNRISLDWQPSALLTGQLHIIRLDIEQPVITTTSQATAPPDKNQTTGLALEDITLPLTLQIDALNISQLSLINAVKEDDQPATTTNVSSAFISVHTSDDTLFIDQFKVVTPQARMLISGQLQPNGQFPLELNIQWSLTLPEQQPLSGQGNITGTLKGDSNTLKVEQTLSGLINTELSASLQNLLEKPQGELTLQHITTDLGQFTPQLSDSNLSGSVTAHGSDDQLKLNSQLETKFPEIGAVQLSLQLHFADNTLQIDQLNLIQTEPLQGNRRNPLMLQLTGKVAVTSEPLSFDIQGHWNNLRYPLQGEAAYLSPKGELQVSGDLQHYRFTINSAFAGPAIPPGQWTLTGSGNSEGLEPFLLTGKTLEGSVRVSGKVRWQPQLNWNLKASGKQLNPGQFWPEWPGKLDFQAAVTGSQPAAEPLRVELLLDSLSGVLRNEPLSSHGKVTVNGSDINIADLRLNIAATAIQASGTIDEELNLSWSAHSPNLNQLLPSLQGSLDGKGTLTGSQKTPHLIATLEGQNLAYDTYQASHLNADLDLNLSPVTRSHIRLSAAQLNIAGNQWQELNIAGQGTPDKHQLTLTTDKGPADLELALSGQWKEEQWHGTLNTLNLIQPQLGGWQIQRPVAVTLSSTAAHLDSLCLNSTIKTDSSLCASTDWSATQGLEAAIDTKQLSLTHLQPWILTQAALQGYLESDLKFSQAPGLAPEIKGYAVLKDTELLLEEDDLKIRADDITLRIQGHNNQLRADLNLPLRYPTGKLSAQVTVDDPYHSRKLNGDLNLSVDDLKFISLFTPQLQAITGQISSQLALSGTVDKPGIEGHLTLNHASADLPALGISLQQINLDVTGEPGSNTLLINGGMQSDNGPVELHGQYNPVADSGELTLEGTRFKAVATEEIQAWISPSVKLNVTPDQIVLRGEIKIPEASIKPPEIEATSPVSDDVVIVDPNHPDTPGATHKRNLDAQMRITLGDKVNLEALGFEGRLLGSVLIEDDGRQVMRATGVMQVASGQYRLYGQDLNIDRGSLVYSGGPVDNPGLDLRVSRQVEDITAGAKVSGTLNDPRLSLFSEPAMPESSQLSYLMFGHAPGAGGNSMSEQELLFKAASALTLKGGNTIAEQISETFNIDELGVAGGDTATDTSLYIGKYLSPRLYVKYGVGLLEPTHTFFMRYRLNDAWSVETQTATEHNGGDIIYTMER